MIDSITERLQWWNAFEFIVNNALGATKWLKPVHLLDKCDSDDLEWGMEGWKDIDSKLIHLSTSKTCIPFVTYEYLWGKHVGSPFQIKHEGSCNICTFIDMSSCWVHISISNNQILIHFHEVMRILYIIFKKSRLFKDISTNPSARSE